jgi:alanine racemase
MLPVVELRARIVQLLSLAPGETIADNFGWTAKRRTRLALVSIGYADRYPRSESISKHKRLLVITGVR